MGRGVESDTGVASRLPGKNRYTRPSVCTKLFNRDKSEKKRRQTFCIIFRPEAGVPLGITSFSLEKN